MEKITSRVGYIFGHAQDVDDLIGMENIRETDIEKLIITFMKNHDQDFVRLSKQGDILIAGKNFGYGHPHPQAMLVMRHLGIKIVIAESFAFPFYRSELASGMLLYECDSISEKFERFDKIEVDIESSTIINLSNGEKLVMKEIPKIPSDIMKSGGIVNFVKDKIKL